MTSHEGETSSDRERRHARRRERRAKRAERHAERTSPSPDKSNTTVNACAVTDDSQPRRVRPPLTPQKHSSSTLHTASEAEEPRRPIDIYSPRTSGKPTPLNTPDKPATRHDQYYTDYQHTSRQDSYEDRDTTRRSNHHGRRDRDDRHDRKEQRHHHNERNSQHYHENRRSHRPELLHRSSTNITDIKESYDEYEGYKRRRWTWSRKIIISAVSIILIMIISLAIAIAVSKKHAFKYTPLYNQVTNSSAFTNGGASNNANDTDDGIGAGTDRYLYYSGPASNFPPKAEWVSFANMWVANRNVILNSCKTLGYGKDDTDGEITDIYDAIQSRASSSLVDHRFILAVILQESHGCVRIATTNNGIKNPGLMQSANGASYSPYHSADSILQMIQDGTQGTKYGDGLVQHLNTHGNAYSAARMYNSGAIADNGDLSNATGATACYVSDVANRLTGWVYATSTCPSSSST